MAWTPLAELSPPSQVPRLCAGAAAALVGRMGVPRRNLSSKFAPKLGLELF